VIPGPTLIVERNRIAEFKDVAALMPDDPVVRFGLAGAYLDAGQSEEAVLEYQETIRLKPDYSVAYRGLSRALEKAGPWPRRRRPTRRALRPRGEPAISRRRRRLKSFCAAWRSAAADQAQPDRGVPRAFLGTSVHANVAGCC
jgi:predicted Zn-dependent protease